MACKVLIFVSLCLHLLLKSQNTLFFSFIYIVICASKTTSDKILLPIYLEKKFLSSHSLLITLAPWFFHAKYFTFNTLKLTIDAFFPAKEEY